MKDKTKTKLQWVLTAKLSEDSGKVSLVPRGRRHLCIKKSIFRDVC